MLIYLIFIEGDIFAICSYCRVYYILAKYSWLKCTDLSYMYVHCASISIFLSHAVISERWWLLGALISIRNELFSERVLMMAPVCVFRNTSLVVPSLHIWWCEYAQHDFVWLIKIIYLGVTQHMLYYSWYVAKSVTVVYLCVTCLSQRSHCRLVLVWCCIA